VSLHKHHPSALIYLDALGPSDGPTELVERFHLLDAVFTTDVHGRRIVRLAMQATALTPPTKHMFIEVEHRLLDPVPACFVKEPLWFENLPNVFRDAAREANETNEGEVRE
jgi:hypothetical protein